MNASPSIQEFRRRGGRPRGGSALSDLIDWAVSMGYHGSSQHEVAQFPGIAEFAMPAIAPLSIAPMSIGIQATSGRTSNIVALPDVVNISMYAGDDFILQLAMWDEDKNAVDLLSHGVTARAHIRITPEDDELLGEFQRCHIVQNFIYMRLSSALTAELPGMSKYDIEITRQIDLGDCAGSHVTTIVVGTITVTPEITR